MFVSDLLNLIARSVRLRAGLLAVPLVLVCGTGASDRDQAFANTSPSLATSATRGIRTADLSSAAAASNSAEALLADWSDVPSGSIDPHVFGLALKASRCAVRTGAIDDPGTLTVIDYSRPSTERRLWVFDLRQRAMLYEELVAHGKGSGDNMAVRFSNVPDTHMSSLGLFLTKDTYVGRNGYSLRLEGLDAGVNDRAYERAIVVHGAPYVSPDVVRDHGRLGRSWGCPALREDIARELIDRVKGSGLLFAYYPDADWLQSSSYLGDCASSQV